MNTSVIDSIPTPDDLSAETVCNAEALSFQYGDHLALADVDLKIHRGEVVALLGPNGSGKTTLFRLLSTLLPIQQGRIQIGGVDSGKNPLAVRSQIGIVFQSPSLDKKLTVDENLACQAALYGITGKEMQTRRDELLRQLDLTDRRGDLCEVLSGGLKRRVELAKGMLHRPSLLLLDEPSTGLDPVARLNLWDAITSLAAAGMSILLTTHLLEEADKADRVMILSKGRKIAEGSPHELRSELGEGVVTVVASDVPRIENVMRQELGLEPQRVHQELRLRTESPAAIVSALIEKIGDQAESITLGRPSLEDVFIARTGSSLAQDQNSSDEPQ